LITIILSKEKPCAWIRDGIVRLVWRSRAWRLESVHGLDVLFLTPETYGCQIYISKLSASCNEILLVKFVQKLVDLGVLRLLELKHSAGEDSQDRIFQALLHDLQCTGDVAA